MRAPHEIRREVLRIRDVNKLTMTAICSRARVSRHDLVSCLAMGASEDTLRKLDAFLDATQLHHRDRQQTLLSHEYEKLSRELWREFKMKTVHPVTFEGWSNDTQKRYINTITSIGKRRLQKRFLGFGLVVKVPDGATYWQFKIRCLHRLQGEKALRTGDRDSRRVPWPRPILLE